MGRVKEMLPWQWAAYGKHSAAKDYFKVCYEFPSFRSYSGWIEKGFQALSARRRTGETSGVWRFWGREPLQGHIACGILRDSSDSIGRPYPLLIIGAGPLRGWEGNWDLLPWVCRSSWETMESLALTRFDDIRSFEAEVQALRPPASDWSEYIVWRERFQSLDRQRIRTLERNVSLKYGAAKGYIDIDGKECGSKDEMIGICHFLLKVHFPTSPNIVFTGERGGRDYLVFFRRPLVSTDFIGLWSDDV